MSAFQAPAISADGQYVTVIVGNLDRRPAWLLERGEGRWREFIPADIGHCLGEFVNGRYVAVTTLDAPRGRLVAVSPAAGDDPSEWAELLPESEAVLRAVSLSGGFLILSELADASCRVRLFDHDLQSSLPVPIEPGTITRNSREAPMLGTPMAASSAHHGDITFVHSTTTTSPAIYHYRAGDTALRAITEPAVTIGAKAFVGHCDGEPTLPYHVSYRDDLDLSQPHPTLITIYGGWNIPTLPRWSPAAALFIAAGGIHVGAVVRGGGEFGTAWWRDGRHDRKQHTFDDLYRLAEHLIATGVTRSDVLALQGGSAGGLAAGVAVTQRPDLFRAVVANAPALDLLRMHKTPTLAKAALEELGDPENPADAAILATYSPYHNIDHGRAYPAFLACCPGEDIRTPPLHGRKFIARLQAATGSDQPHLLRIWRGIGHGVGITTPVTSSERLAEWLGFLMERVGLEAPDLTTEER